MARGSMWSSEEWELVTDLVWNMRVRHPEMTIIQLAKKANEQLPKARQRKSLCSNVQIKPVLEKLAIRDMAAKKALEAALKQKPIEAPTLTDEQARERYGHLFPKEVETVVVERELSTSKAVGLAVEKLLATVGPKLGDFLAAVTAACEQYATLDTPPVKPKAAPAPLANVVHERNGQYAPKPHLPKVAVLGALPIQQQHIESHLKGICECRFLDKSRVSGDLGLGGMQLIATMAEFIDHGLQDKVKADYKHIPLLVAHGAVSQLCRKIRDHLAVPA